MPVRKDTHDCGYWQKVVVMSHWVTLIVFVVTAGCGIVGLTLQRWLRDRMSDDTRDLINRVTGLVGTMTALVLGLLIASSGGDTNLRGRLGARQSDASHRRRQ